MAANKGRSPRYPRFNLSEAIERANRVYRAESTHPAPKNVVAHDLGYGGLHGASQKVIGTLKGYGLLKDEGDNLKVTDLAVAAIVSEKGNPERAEALREAAFSPPLFADLQTTYPEGLPSNATLQHYLIHTKGFMPQAVDSVIRVYRENLELVAQETVEYPVFVSDDEHQQVVEPISETEAEQQVVSPPSGSSVEVTEQAPPAPTKHFRFDTSEESEARIEWVGPLTRNSFETLIAILEAQKLAYPARQRPEQRMDEPPAIEMPEPE